MLKVCNIRVRSFDLDYLDIVWEIGPTTEDIFDYDFYVQRSENEYSDYVDIVGPFTDAYRFRDLTRRGQKNFFRRFYYRIRVVHRETAATETYPEEGGVALRADPDLVALEMSRNARLRLQEFSGRKVWLFPIRTFGQTCTCKDSVTGRRKRSLCPVCFDSGWVGGYHRPLEVYMQIITPPEATTRSDLNEVQNMNATGRIGNYPELHSRWVVVEAENIRWRVGEGIKKVEKGRAVIRQDFPLHRIPVGDIEYTLPISLTQAEVDALQPTAQRLYTNPQDIGEGGKPLAHADLRSLYRV